MAHQNQDFVGAFISQTSSIVGGVGAHLQGLADACGKEVRRGAHESYQNVTSDIDSVRTAVQRGGFLGGAIEACDVLSPGHQVASAADAWNVIPEDARIRELVSAGVNLCIPGGLGGLLLAAKDLADAANAQAPAGSPTTVAGSQSCPKPDASHATCRGYGDSAAGYTLDWNCLGDFRNFELILERQRSCCEAIRKGASGEDNDEFDRILNDKSLCFEDMIALLMRVIIKDSQDEVDGFLEEIHAAQKADKAARKASEANFAARETKVIELDRQARKSNSPDDAAKASTARAELTTDKMNANTDVEDRMTSRAEAMEQLKLAMQRVSEMEQALSNILNTLHETAMAAIHNIR